DEGILLDDIAVDLGLGPAVGGGDDLHLLAADIDGLLSRLRLVLCRRRSAGAEANPCQQQDKKGHWSPHTTGHGLRSAWGQWAIFPKIWPRHNPGIERQRQSLERAVANAEMHYRTRRSRAEVADLTFRRRGYGARGRR